MRAKRCLECVRNPEEFPKDRVKLGLDWKRKQWSKFNPGRREASRCAQSLEVTWARWGSGVTYAVWGVNEEVEWIQMLSFLSCWGREGRPLLNGGTLENYTFKHMGFKNLKIITETRVSKLWPAGQIWPTICLCKVLLEHSHACLFTHGLWLFCATMTELSSCNRSRGPWSLQYLLYELLQKQFAESVTECS